MDRLRRRAQTKSWDRIPLLDPSRGPMHPRDPAVCTHIVSSLWLTWRCRWYTLPPFCVNRDTLKEQGQMNQRNSSGPAVLSGFTDVFPGCTAGRWGQQTERWHGQLSRCAAITEAHCCNRPKPRTCRGTGLTPRPSALALQEAVCAGAGSAAPGRLQIQPGHLCSHTGLKSLPTWATTGFHQKASPSYKGTPDQAGRPNTVFVIKVCSDPWGQTKSVC